MMAADTRSRVDDLASIHNVIFQWCRGVDRQDWDLVRSTFHADGWDDHGIFNGDVDGMIHWLETGHAHISQSMHCVSNVFIEFANDATALAESYVVAHQTYPGGDLSSRKQILGDEIGGQPGDLCVELAGRYVDIVEKREGEWRILKRSVVFESMAVERKNDRLQFPEHWTTQRRDQKDIIFKYRSELGLE